MTVQDKKFICLMTIGLASLGGCEAPNGGRYNNAAHDAPFYDADVYVPQYTIEPSYNHSYYHEDIYKERP